MATHRCMYACKSIYSSLDEHRQGFITVDQFRGAIEHAFDLQLTDEQFLTLIDHVPLTKYGQVKYPEFMSQFDTRYYVALLSGIASRLYVYSYMRLAS